LLCPPPFCRVTRSQPPRSASLCQSLLGLAGGGVLTFVLHGRSPPPTAQTDARSGMDLGTSLNCPSPSAEGLACVGTFETSPPPQPPATSPVSPSGVHILGRGTAPLACSRVLVGRRVRSGSAPRKTSGRRRKKIASKSTAEARVGRGGTVPLAVSAFCGCRCRRCLAFPRSLAMGELGVAWAGLRKRLADAAASGDNARRGRPPRGGPAGTSPAEQMLTALCAMALSDGDAAAAAAYLEASGCQASRSPSAAARGPAGEPFALRPGQLHGNVCDRWARLSPADRALLLDNDSPAWRARRRVGGGGRAVAIVIQRPHVF